MNIDKAIQHLDDILQDDEKWKDCIECKTEHIQLREWLKELRTLREEINSDNLISRAYLLYQFENATELLRHDNTNLIVKSVIQSDSIIEFIKCCPSINKTGW